MKKRLLALLLSAAFALNVSAAAGGTEHFTRTKDYAGQFSDLTEKSPFYDNVSALYEYGLSVGKADGSFGLKDAVTVGQLTIFASRIRSLYQTGSTESGADLYRAAAQSAYEPYLRYLQSEGVVGSELDGLCFKAATRAVVAHVLANVLPAGEMTAINEELVTQCYASRKFITDVTEYTDYYQDILTLYKCGISQGGDETGTFQPTANITRGALSAMVTRVVDASLRTTPAWDLSLIYSARGATLASLVPAAKYLAAPADAQEVAQDVTYMLSAGTSALTLRYGDKISALAARRIMEQALTAVKESCEQGYNAVSCTFDGPAVTLTFTAAGRTSAETAALREETVQAAIAVHDALWESGCIREEMTQREKALVYYNWICENCAYDTAADDTSLSHTAYSLFKNGAAVCDGYTGAYNLLLKLEGISCRALSNTTHIWTVASLDGTECHIDTTWGDSSGVTVDETYFAMTAAQSWSRHRW